VTPIEAPRYGSHWRRPRLNILPFHRESEVASALLKSASKTK